jgi:hypothetical protein
MEIFVIVWQFAKSVVMRLEYNFWIPWVAFGFLLWLLWNWLYDSTQDKNWVSRITVGLFFVLWLMLFLLWGVSGIAFFVSLVNM